jgi:hypothetical protein
MTFPYNCRQCRWVWWIQALVGDIDIDFHNHVIKKFFEDAIPKGKSYSAVCFDYSAARFPRSVQTH